MVIRQVFAAWDPTVMPVGSVAAWGKNWQDRVLRIGSVFTHRKNVYGEGEATKRTRPYRFYTLGRFVRGESYEAS